MPQRSELDELQSLNRNMEVVIALLLRLVSPDNKRLPLKEQMALLDGLGVRPISIASIVGKTPGHVSKELVAIRRAAKK
jgi:hypothetical protein